MLHVLTTSAANWSTLCENSSQVELADRDEDHRAWNSGMDSMVSISVVGDGGGTTVSFTSVGGPITID